MSSKKRVVKVISAVVLCVVIALSGVVAGNVTSYAAQKQSLTVVYCGKPLKLVNNFYTVLAKKWVPVKISAVEKKWGKPTKVKKDGYGMYDATWKKGKTSIEISNFGAKTEGDVGSIYITIKDKNASIYGVKVGMTKAAALKKLYKEVGKKKVIVLKEGLEPELKMDKNGYAVGFTGSSGKATGNKECIYVTTGPYYPMSITLTKSGKVNGIYYYNS